MLIGASYLAKVAFACKPVNERTFMESGHAVIEIGGNNTLDLRMTCKLTEVKQQLTDLLILLDFSLVTIPCLLPVVQNRLSQI